MKNLTEAQRQELFGFMEANDDDDAPDGAWQARLEDAAEEWGEQNGIEIDGFDALFAYIDREYSSESPLE